MDNTVRIVVAGANGRMGRAICNLARAEAGFELAGCLERPEAVASLQQAGVPVASEPEVLLSACKGAVIVDFTAPESTLRLARLADRFGCSLVIGTTGFDADQRKELAALAARAPILLSANMSIGVNALLMLLPRLAQALGPAYDVEISEIHHRNKKDSPSGTALALGEAVACAKGWQLEETRISCRDGIIGARPERQIGIQALRGGDVVGIHNVYFLGPGEMIEITHQAETRENFAQGALRAAAWLCDQQPGRLYSMQDVLRDMLQKEPAGEVR